MFVRQIGKTLIISCSLVLFDLSSLLAQESWKFVSTPDFLNVDVGDLTKYDQNYSGPNSFSNDWSNAVHTFLEGLAAEHPDFVAVAGDLVMARWFLDGTFRGMFGPKLGENGYNKRTLAIEEQRIENAANFYFSELKGFFYQHGLIPYVAIGDHELGDDYSWHADHQSDAYGATYGRETVEKHRQIFAQHFVEPFFKVIPEDLASGSITYNGRPAGGQHANTAYAIQHKNLLLISVDVFKQTAPSAPVTETVDGEQLAWLEQTLALASADPSIHHVVVQGHTPVLQPVYKRVSGGLALRGGANSAFWQTLLKYGDDIYLTGEVHDVDVDRKPGQNLFQIAHGGILGAPQAVSKVPGRGNFISYLVAEVFQDSVDLTVKKIDLHFPHGSTTGRQNSLIRLFQSGNPTTAFVTEFSLANAQDPTIMGTVTLDKSTGTTKILNATGVFEYLDESWL
ncbi:MAG: hypothetical protein WA970_00265 [Gammaproteobacteria bacterium]